MPESIQGQCYPHPASIVTIAIYSDRPLPIRLALYEALSYLLFLLKPCAAVIVLVSLSLSSSVTWNIITART